MVKFNRARRRLPRALAARAEQADSHDPVLFSESGMGRDRATSLRRPRHSQTSWTRLATECVLPAATIMAFLALPGFYQLLFLYLEPGEDMSPRASAE